MAHCQKSFRDVVYLQEFIITIQVYRGWAVKKSVHLKTVCHHLEWLVCRVRGRLFLCSISFCLRKAHTKCSKVNQKWGRHMHRSKGSIQYWSTEKAIFLPSCPILNNCCLDYGPLTSRVRLGNLDPCLVFLCLPKKSNTTISIVAVLICSLSESPWVGTITKSHRVEHICSVCGWDRY